MTALAELGDLEDMWRPLSDDEKPRALNLLEKASGLLRQKTRQTIDTRIGLFTTDPTDPRAVDPQVVATVVATVVKRFLSNVDGAASTTETAGPFSKSTAYVLRGDKNDVRGELVVTDQDIEALAPEVPAQVGSMKVGESPTLKAGRRSTRFPYNQGVWPTDPLFRR